MDEYGTSGSSDYAINSWVSLFLSSKGNEYFCEVDEDYILDRFNLTGLNNEVQWYSQALDTITDALDEDLDDEQREAVEAQARLLYGLVHARYILSTRGLAKMFMVYPGMLPSKSPGGAGPFAMMSNSAHRGHGVGQHGGASGAGDRGPEDAESGSTTADLVPGQGGPGGLGGPASGSNSISAASTANAASKVERYRPRIYGFPTHQSSKLFRWQERQRDLQIERLEAAERSGSLHPAGTSLLLAATGAGAQGQQQGSAGPAGGAGPGAGTRSNQMGTTMGLD
ncbi:casein kinase 2 regulatory subunit [Tilletia horrida]|uniref:Casein kinase II subunit beta n=1 Tax=Tilletia horrida TaxID=155126 RepID=A0AAN6GU58_9BASI|nr:casein kinase 2 regulatory subunit [Tilletia horrida]KAK0550434.1 casein kinase 2 regulatory subunit [Tilletia horrida]